MSITSVAQPTVHVKTRPRAPDGFDRKTALRARAEVFWKKEFSQATRRLISNKTGKSITRPGTPMAVCSAIAKKMDNVRVEAEIADLVTILRPDRERTERTYNWQQERSLVVVGCSACLKATGRPRP